MELSQLMRCCVLTFFLPFFVSASLLQASGFTITRNGEPRCVIVAGDELSLSEKTALEDLQRYVQQMSGGAWLRQVALSERSSGARIVIGAEAVATLYPRVDLSGLGDEGFILKQEGADLLIAGGQLRGTMYGVYTLLEELGCYWLAPGEQLIPQEKTLIVRDLDTRQVPVLKQRNVMYMGTGKNPWSARNKINVPGWSTIPEEYGGTFQTAGYQGHNLFKLMKEAGVEVTEDMWSLWKGKRNNAQLCMTDPRVVEGLTAGLIQVAKSNTGVPYVVLSKEDNKQFCECERCAEADSKAQGRPFEDLDMLEHGGSFFFCVNAAARAMAIEVPDTKLMFYAYLTTRAAPPHVTFEPNTIVALALIESNYMRPLAAGHVEENVRGRDDMVGWSQLIDEIFVWDYVVNYTHYNMPFPNLDVLVPNVKFYVDNNVTYLMEQAAHTGMNAEFSQLRRWVLAKAMWNPEADNQALIYQFLTLYYGPAAPAIQEYIDVMHQPARTEVFESTLTDRLNVTYLRPEVIAAAEVALQKADKLAAGHPEYERRVRQAHLPILYVIAHRTPDGATWEAVRSATRKEVDLKAIAQQVRQVTRDRPENRDMAYGDSEPFEPWVVWLEDYSAQLVKSGTPIPSELLTTSKRSYTLIQACQMDTRSRWWQESEGASDGWACKISTSAWTVYRYLIEGEEMIQGQEYEFFVRIKPGEKLAETGKAFLIGDYGNNMNPYGKHPEWDVSKLKAGEYQVVKIGEGSDLDGVWFAANPQVLESYELDCFWIVKK